MAFLDGLMKKLKVSADDEQVDEYDEYDDYDTPEEEAEEVEEKPKKAPVQPTKTYTMKGGSRGNEICMIMATDWSDCHQAVDALLHHRAVLFNIEQVDLLLAQRMLDFLSGACFTIDGGHQKISKKVWILSPQDMTLSGDFDKIAGEASNLNDNSKFS